MNVSIHPSGRIIACVSGVLSYCSSSRFRLVDSLSCGGLVMSGSDEVESAGGGGGGGYWWFEESHLCPHIVGYVYTKVLGPVKDLSLKVIFCF